MEATYRKTNIMYIPALLLFAVFVVYPFLDGVRIAFTNWNGFSQHYRFVGAKNFLRLATDPNVLTAFVNTLLYGFGSTLFQQILGLAYALFLNVKFKGRSAARTVIYMPALISAVIMGYMWYYLVKYDGALNDLLGLFGTPKILWLSRADLAVGVLITINTLQYVGVSMVIYLAGLQGIPSMYYEAAGIDGASSWSVFREITLPLLYPSVLTSTTINLIGGLKLFDIVKALTGGGPGYTTHSLSTLLHSTYFGSQMAGFAAAIGMLLFVSIFLVNLLLQRVLHGREVQYA